MENTLNSEAEEAKASLSMKCIFLVNFFINFFGTILHLGLILVTLRNNKFHSACHVLIAANSVSTILAYLLVLTPLWLVLVPGEQLQLGACFALQFLPMLGSFQIYALMLAIGVDRLMSGFFVKWYISRNERLYLLLVFSISALFPIAIVGRAFLNVLNPPEGEMLCTLGEILDQQSLSVSFSSMGCIILSVACYTAVWIKFKLANRANKSGHGQSWQPIFRSLCIILCVQVFGWVVGQSVFAVVYLNATRIPNLTRWQVNMLAMCFLSVTAALDVPVLYSTSSDYRAAFHKQFPWLHKFLAVKKQSGGGGTVIVQFVKSRASSITPVEKPF